MSWPPEAKGIRFLGTPNKPGIFKPCLTSGMETCWFWKGSMRPNQYLAALRAKTIESKSEASEDSRRLDATGARIPAASLPNRRRDVQKILHCFPKRCRRQNDFVSVLVTCPLKNILLKTMLKSSLGKLARQPAKGSLNVFLQFAPADVK